MTPQECLELAQACYLAARELPPEQTYFLLLQMAKSWVDLSRARPHRRENGVAMLRPECEQLLAEAYRQIGKG